MEMIKVNVENVKRILVTTSNRVAEELGVRHDHLLEKIEDYIKKLLSPTLNLTIKVIRAFSYRLEMYYICLFTCFLICVILVLSLFKHKKILQISLHF